MGAAENNLKKLARTNLPMNFVKKNNGNWNHDEWMAFCDFLKEKGYTPIEFDQVGLLLEKKKAEYLERATCSCK